MKKTISIILAAAMLMSLASCKKKENPAESASPSPSAAASAAPAAEAPAAEAPAASATAAPDVTEPPINGGSLNEQNTVGVQQNSDSVSVTLPAEFFDENTSTELTEDMKAQGYQSVTKNADGSVTYVMTKDGYTKLKADMKNKVIDYMENEVKSGDKFKSIKDVEYTDDFSIITLTVDKKAFESSLDVMASRAIYMMVAGYKVFCGEPADKANVTIVYIDKSSKKEISRTLYPDALSAKQ